MERTEWKWIKRRVVEEGVAEGEERKDVRRPRVCLRLLSRLRLFLRLKLSSWGPHHRGRSQPRRLRGWVEGEFDVEGFVQHSKHELEGAVGDQVRGAILANILG